MPVSRKNLSFFEGAIIIVFFVISFFAWQNVQAASTSTLRGAAWWSEQYGYVAFDCADDYTGDRLDQSGNFNAYPLPQAFHLYVTPCEVSQHGVSIAPNGNFSGQAWNYSKGFISFAGTDTPPEDGYGFNSHCPATCNSSNSCWACYNEEDNQVYGWARVDSDNSWIRLNYATDTPVMIQGWDTEGDPVLPGHEIAAGDFVGYASSSDWGALSFNCESEGDGTCATRNYKIYISNVQVGLMTAPNWSTTQACSSAVALRAVLQWAVRSGTQAGYEIVVNHTDDSATSTADCWSGVKTPSTATQYIIPNSDPYCSSFDYGTNYYWWIRLYYEDNGDYLPTEWYKFGSSVTSVSTDGDPDSNDETFTTFRHEFPSPYFTWSPEDIEISTSTDFVSDSHYYSDASPDVQLACNGFCQYLWTTDQGAVISDPTSATTSMIFNRATSTTVTLRITDPENYVCSYSQAIRINFGLPIWREIRAE